MTETITNSRGPILGMIRCASFPARSTGEAAPCYYVLDLRFSPEPIIQRQSLSARKKPRRANPVTRSSSIGTATLTRSPTTAPPHLPDYSAEGVRRHATARRLLRRQHPVRRRLPGRPRIPPLSGLRRAALLSDGAARLVERFHVADWQQLLDVLAAEGPEELIRRTREAENAETTAERAQRRGKMHDDATAILVSHLNSGSPSA